LFDLYWVVIKNTEYNLALPTAIFAMIWIGDNHLVSDNVAIAPVCQIKPAAFHLENNNQRDQILSLIG